MDKLNLTIDQLEDEIATAYKMHLVNTGRLTVEQARDAEYSYALPEIRQTDEPLTPEEREDSFKDFALNIFGYHLSEQRDLLKTKLCDEANYCKNRNSQGMSLLLNTLDGFVSLAVGFPAPTLTVLAWLIKTKWLDNLCQCS